IRALIEYSLRPWLEGNILGLQVGGNIAEIFIRIWLPDSGQVRVAVGSFRSGRGKVRLAISRSRYPLRWQVQPLPRGEHGQHRQQSRMNVETISRLHGRLAVWGRLYTRSGREEFGQIVLGPAICGSNSQEHIVDRYP